MLEMLAGDRVRSLTYDRGLEWMRHAEVGAHFGAVSWFCLPYHSWEKGGVENMNGQVRFYFPKHEPFPYEEVEPEWVQEVEDALNGRPRRILGYRTPVEAQRELEDQGACGALRAAPPGAPATVRIRSGLRAAPGPRYARERPPRTLTLTESCLQRTLPPVCGRLNPVKPPDPRSEHQAVRLGI